MKKILSIVALVAFLLFVGFTLFKNKEIIDANTQDALSIENYDYIPVTVHQVSQQNIDRQVEEIGSFESRQELTVTASAAGRITQINIKEGQYVQKGAVIARIEHTALNSQLATTKTALNNAIKDLKRVQNAHQVGATTKMQVEQAELQVENLKSSITGIEDQIDFYTVTAPMSAYVNKIYAEQGSQAMPGSPIVELVDISTIKMVVKISENLVPLLSIGKSVPVTTEVFPDRTITGKISRIAVRSDASKKYEVEIDIPNSDNQIKAGMYGKVTFDNLSAGESIYIPRNAIVGSVSEAQVYIVQADSTVKFAPVTVGGYQGNNIEVLDGLDAGDLVVLMGHINLREGVQVSVVK